MIDLRVVSKPTVKLVGFTHYDDHEIDLWCRERGIEYDTDAVADGDAMPELAGRLCYLSLNKELRRVSGDGQNRAYLDHIREVGHGSVTEHTVFNFIIDDFTKTATQELVRHRVGTAFSVQSSRYVDTFSTKYFGDSGHCIGVHIPEAVQGDAARYERWLAIWQIVAEEYTRSYKELRDEGHAVKDARSMARHILPGSICNALMFTCNARELNHIFKLRGNFHADGEIRALAVELFKCVENHTLFNNWELRVDEKHGEYLFDKESDLLFQIRKLMKLHTMEKVAEVVNTYTHIIEGRKASMDVDVTELPVSNVSGDTIDLYPQ